MKQVVARHRNADVQESDLMRSAPGDRTETGADEAGRRHLDANNELPGDRALDPRIDRRQRAVHARTRANTRHERSLAIAVPAIHVRHRRSGIAVGQHIGEQRVGCVSLSGEERRPTKLPARRELCQSRGPRATHPPA